MLTVPVREGALVRFCRALAPAAALVAFAVSLVSACRARQPGDVVIAALTARTGARAAWGEDLLRGMDLAVAHVNHRGGLLGRRVRLVSVDDASREENAGMLAGRLLERERPLALFGEVSSAACERAALIAQRRSVPFIAAANTQRDLVHIGDFVFRTAATDAEQAAILARYVRTTHERGRAAIVYRRTSLLHLAIADAFSRAFRAAGGDVVLRDTFESDDTEIVRLAARIRASGADVVFVPAQASDGGRMASALRHGRVSAQITGTDGWASPDLRRFDPESLQGVLIVDAYASDSPRPEVAAFQHAFRESYRASPGTFAALGFDAVRWVLAVAARVPVLDPRALRDALANSRLREGVAAPFSVDERRIASRAVNILRVETGELFRFVESTGP